MTETRNESTLRDLLRENLVEITFTKRDGTERVLLGTLQEEYLPARAKESSSDSEKESISTSTSTRKRSANIISVWDVENEGFRSIRNDSIISYLTKT